MDLARPTTTALACASHSPLLYCFESEPADWVEMQDTLAARRSAVQAFDPELIIIFGADHFNGFFLDVMPAFCIGLEAEAGADIGGHAGQLDVPSDLATALVEHVRAAGVDSAVSYRMTVDHAFSQTLHILTGDIGRVPTIPIYISCITRPFVPFARTRALGEAVGAFVTALDRRVLLVGSGGMSHHPAHYYPEPGTAELPVAQWQMTGGGGPGSLDRDGWLERLDVMHREGAALIARGERTAADMRINPDRDSQFLRLLCGFELETFDGWDVATLADEAGIGSTELHTWIAAAAAHRAAGGSPPVVDIYSVAPEIGIAFGVVHSDA